VDRARQGGPLGRNPSGSKPHARQRRLVEPVADPAGSSLVPVSRPRPGPCGRRHGTHRAGRVAVFSSSLLGDRSDRPACAGPRALDPTGVEIDGCGLDCCGAGDSDPASVRARGGGRHGGAPRTTPWADVGCGRDARHDPGRRRNHLVCFRCRWSCRGPLCLVAPCDATLRRVVGGRPGPLRVRVRPGAGFPGGGDDVAHPDGAGCFQRSRTEGEEPGWMVGRGCSIRDDHRGLRFVEPFAPEVCGTTRRSFERVCGGGPSPAVGRAGRRDRCRCGGVLGGSCRAAIGLGLSRPPESSASGPRPGGSACRGSRRCSRG